MRTPTTAPETLVITYRTVVLNSTNNTRGGQRRNTAVWSWQDDFGPQQVSARAPNVRIVEPTLQVVKEANPLTGEAGDAITFTLLVRHSGTSNAGAFDVVLTDLIPTNMTYVAGSLTHTGGLVPTTLVEPGTGITVVWTAFPTGSVSTLKFDATLDITILPGQIITNEAIVLYTSLPGDETVAQSPYNALSTERTGNPANPGGTANNYRTSDTAVVTVIDPRIMDKTIVQTSEPHTTGTDVAIGEIVRYRLQATMIEGTMPNVQFVDHLQPGLMFLDVGEVRVSFISDTPVTTAPDLAGANGGPIPPVFVMPADRIAVSGQQITFDFGTLINNDNDPDDEIVVIEFNALVLNTAETNDGETKANWFEIRLGQTVVATSLPVAVTIREPSIANLDKHVLGAPPLDAGDTVTYRLTYSNTGTTDAFDVRVVDALDAVYLTRSTAPAIVLAGGAAGSTDNSTGNTIDVTIARIPVGGSVTIVYSAVLTTAVEPDSVVSNTANLTYTSLPGLNGTVNNPTGSSTPGGSGSADGERNGSGGVNDYADSDIETIRVQLPSLSKSLIATNQPHTLDRDVAIGEIVTYEVVVTVPEGTMSAAVLVDTPSAGLAIVDVVSVVSNSAALSTSVGTFVQVRDNANGALPASGSSVTFDFGTLINADTDNTVTETITIVYRAVVLNAAANVRDSELDNAATLAWSQGELTDSAGAVIVVEPTLTIDKLDGVPIMGDAGDIVTFEILVQHAPGSNADAFDVNLADWINSIANKLTYVPGTLSVVNVGGAVLAAGSPSDAGGDVAIVWSQFPLSASAAITFDVVLDIDVQPGEILINSASLTWTSLPGNETVPQSSNPNSVERTGDPNGPGERNDYAADDSGVVSVYSLDPAKTLVATSEPHTAGNDVAIGEIVRYRLRTTLVEGTHWDLRLIDTLPAGLILLDPDQVRVSFTANNPLGLDGDLIAAQDGQVPPAFVLPSDRIVVAGQQITFLLGNIVNNDNDPDDEFITLEFNVLVTNTAATNAGEIKSNAFQVLVGGTQSGDTQSVDVQIVEPRIDDVAKQFVTMTGNERTFQVTFSNTGTTTAFDTRVTDIVPLGAVLDVFSVAVILGGGASGSDTAGSTPGLLVVAIDELPPGGTVSIQYTLTLSAASQTGLLNQADVTYTSLLGPDGTATNSTGSSTPGAPGAADGERTGDGGVNDYADGDSQTLGSLGNFVWHDLNGNGIQEAGEPGVPGVAVQAVWAGPDGVVGTGDDVTLNTVTDGGGIYFFNALPPGWYQVVFTSPSEFALTAQNADGLGVTGALNSDADPLTGRTPTFALAAGENVTYVDAGLWAADLSISKVDCVTSVGAGYDTVYDYAITVTNHGPSPAPNVIVTDLWPEFLTRIGFVYSLGTVNDLPSGDFEWLIGSLQPGQSVQLVVNYTVDAGATGTITNTATVMSDAPDVNPLNNAATDTNTVGALFIQGTAFIDGNGNNQLDPDEAYKPDAPIYLDYQGCDGQWQLIGETRTDANGYYIFENLAPGNYRVVEGDVSHLGYASSGTEIRSDIYEALALNASTIQVELVEPLTVRYSSYSATQFVNANRFGVPLNNLRSGQLRFQASDDGGATFGPLFYTFCIDLYHALISPGDTYQVVAETAPRFPGLEQNIGRIGFLFNQYGTVSMGTTVAAALNLALWELVYDVTPDLTAGNFRASATSTTMAWASYYLNVSAGKYEAVMFLNVDDPDVDPADPMQNSRSQGILAQNSFNFANVPAPTTADLGDFVWIDADGNGIQDAGETGVNGVTVHLLDAGGNVIASTSTANGASGDPGYYRFAELPPGTYSVQFVLPGGFAFAPQDADGQGVHGPVNSDADPLTGQTPAVTLVAGQSNLDLDAGLLLVGTAETDLSVTKTDCVTSVGAGYGTVYETKISVTNHGPSLAENVIVTDVWPDFLTLVDLGYLTGTVNQLPNGDLQWLIGDLADGASVELTVTYTVDAGATGAITNTVTVASDTPDPNLLNNTASDTNTVGTLFIHGTAFIDGNGNNRLDANEAYKPDAPIYLYYQDCDGQWQLIGQRLTDANGYYLFENLAAGNYRVAEGDVSHLGYVSSGTQIRSNVYDAFALNPATIQVELVEPLTARLSSFAAIQTVNLNRFGVPLNSARAGQLRFQVSDNGGANYGPLFNAFCIDLYHALISPGDTYAVVAENAPRFPGLVQNVGRIGFLYNQFGTVALSSTNAAALNLALWELVYDATPNLAAGNFRASASSATMAWANYYLNVSAGKYEAVMFLNVPDPDVNPTDPMENSRSQGIVAQTSFNFANVPVPGIQGFSLMFAEDYNTSTGTSLDFVEQTVELPGGRGTNKVEVSVQGNDLVVMSGRTLLFREPWAGLSRLTIVGADNKADAITLNLGKGGMPSLEIVVNGGIGSQTDTLTIVGTAGDDVFAVERDGLLVNGQLLVSFQNIQQVALDGGAGNDTYSITNMPDSLSITDKHKTSIDTLDFSGANSGVTVDLNSTRAQTLLGGRLTLKSKLENLIGTPFDDRLLGNNLANRIWGGDGNDWIDGRGGNDWLTARTATTH
jgi:fimbrial isopeptide formation D2 family protein/uncharacterized repeat protein (TIGR01451 family)